MLTRLARRERPRRTTLLFVTVAAAASLLIASVALAVINDSGTYSVIVPDKTQSSGLVDIGNASVEYIGSSAQDQASGTGLFDPFVRLQGDPTESGYNTDGAVEFDTKTGKWTHAILASAIPQVACAGGDNTTGQCWELFVDINESNTAKYISLNEVEIYFTSDANLTGYSFGSNATLEYDFSGTIKIHDVNQGSGRGDLRLLVPVQPFTSTTYFVLYSEWGTTAGEAPDGKTWASEGGFEEWKVRKAPNVGIVKTADAASVNAGQDIGFTITVTNTGPADATGVTINDPLPGGSGIDWSESPDNPDCSISGSPPNETLTCGPVTLAAGGGSLSVHVQSATTGDSCGTYDNTATFTSTNAGTGSDSASVTVNCAAIRILKNSLKGGPVANAGAVFSITGPGSYSASVTDNGTGDEDSDVGEICVSGLVPGSYSVSETTPPTGYSGTGSGTAVATAGTNCTTSQPTGTDVLSLTNDPLYDIQVNFRDGGSGETSATISCSGGGIGTGDSTAATGWDTSKTFEDEVLTTSEEVITCTITVDP